MKSKMVCVFMVVVLAMAASSVMAQAVSLKEVSELRSALEWKAAVEIRIQNQSYESAITAMTNYKQVAEKARDFDQQWFFDRVAEIKKMLQIDITAVESRINNGDWSGFDTLIYYQNLSQWVENLNPLTAKAESSAKSPSP